MRPTAGATSTPTTTCPCSVTPTQPWSAAASAQLATLNTNSRYLQDAPVELAERLLDTVPDRFDRVLLVNSGSEANDLAWRIARHASGMAGGIATEWAYHGVTEATYAFSPESWCGAARLPTSAWCRRRPTPRGSPMRSAAWRSPATV